VLRSEAAVRWALLPLPPAADTALCHFIVALLLPAACTGRLPAANPLQDRWLMHCLHVLPAYTAPLYCLQTSP
jgi:hypothetical protein